ncbi:MAG: BCAM0308 family protein [Elusimicrobia bacterium]|nr:BCAM0308 family protein [Elusimicrobiota bacterium]
MRANIAVHARSSREINEKVADPYMRVSKIPQPAVCGGCGAVFLKGRWQWAPHAPKGAARETCQACRRVQDDFPAGIMTLRGAFVRSHLQEVLAIARNQEQAENKDHPLHRIMGVEEKRNRVVIKTTDIHLPGRIGRALLRSHKGELDVKYDEGAYFVRASWNRET